MKTKSRRGSCGLSTRPTNKITTIRIKHVVGFTKLKSEHLGTSLKGK
jgi:hypothetical protein